MIDADTKIFLIISVFFFLISIGCVFLITVGLKNIVSTKDYESYKSKEDCNNYKKIDQDSCAFWNGTKCVKDCKTKTIGIVLIISGIIGLMILALGSFLYYRHLTKTKIFTPTPEQENIEKQNQVRDAHVRNALGAFINNKPGYNGHTFNRPEIQERIRASGLTAEELHENLLNPRTR
jgi:hypothetical protein